MRLPSQALAGASWGARRLHDWGRMSRDCDSVCPQENKSTKMIYFSIHQRNEVRSASLAARGEPLPIPSPPWLQLLSWGMEDCPARVRSGQINLLTPAWEEALFPLLGTGGTYLVGALRNALLVT